MSRRLGAGGQIQVPRGGVLLEDVVLDRAGELRPGDVLALGGGHVEGQQDRGRPVDGEAGADLVQGDAVEQHLGVGQGVDGDADPAHLLAHLGVVGVVAALGRQVKRYQQPGAALLEQVAVAAVGLLGGAEPGVLPQRPQPALVTGGIAAAGEGEAARLGGFGLPVGWSVDRLERDAGRRLGRLRLGRLWLGRLWLGRLWLGRLWLGRLWLGKVVHHQIRHLQKMRIPISIWRMM